MIPLTGRLADVPIKMTVTPALYIPTSFSSSHLSSLFFSSIIIIIFLHKNPDRTSHTAHHSQTEQCLLPTQTTTSTMILFPIYSMITRACSYTSPNTRLIHTTLSGLVSFSPSDIVLSTSSGKAGIRRCGWVTTNERTKMLPSR